MFFPLDILGIGTALVAAIFVGLFVYLTLRWALKRGREISKKFEYEVKELKSTEARVREIEERINSLRAQYAQAISRNELKTAESLSEEINKLEKERSMLYKKIRRY